MKEFTIQEVVEYAQKIETESYRFYRKMAAILEEPATVEFAEKLSMEEEKHYNQLAGLLTGEEIAPEQLETRVALEGVDDLDGVVPNREIPEDSTALEILNITLERERRTEQLYGMLLVFTDLNAVMVKVFEDLKGFEKSHVARVSAMIERLR